jgi:prevent-host-death family protein
MTTLIEIDQLEGRFQEILGRAKAGDEVIVTKGSVPQARLVPIAERVPGLHPGAFQTAADFDSELEDSFWFGQP